MSKKNHSERVQKLIHESSSDENDYSSNKGYDIHSEEESNCAVQEIFDISDDSNDSDDSFQFPLKFNKKWQLGKTSVQNLKQQFNKEFKTQIIDYSSLKSTSDAAPDDDATVKKLSPNEIYCEDSSDEDDVPIIVQVKNSPITNMKTKLYANLRTATQTSKASSGSFKTTSDKVSQDLTTVKSLSSNSSNDYLCSDSDIPIIVAVKKSATTFKKSSSKVKNRRVSQTAINEVNTLPTTFNKSSSTVQKGTASQTSINEVKTSPTTFNNTSSKVKKRTASQTSIDEVKTSPTEFNNTSYKVQNGTKLQTSQDSNFSQYTSGTQIMMEYTNLFKSNQSKSTYVTKYDATNPNTVFESPTQKIDINEQPLTMSLVKNYDSISINKNSYSSKKMRSSACSKSYQHENNNPLKQEMNQMDNVKVIDSLPKVYYGNKLTEKASKLMNDAEEILLLQEHLGYKIKPEKIQFQNGPTFVNKIQKCPIKETEPCKLCERFCFSEQLRGVSPATKEWFTTHEGDSASIWYYSDGPEFMKMIQKDFLPNESKLRNITRKQLYDTLVQRFRGFYNKDEDIISFIANSKHFDNWWKYMAFKTELDTYVINEWHRKAYFTFFCTGCGIRCEMVKKVDIQTGEAYRVQVCANPLPKRKCSFRYDMRKTYVYLKKTPLFYRFKN